MRLGLCIVLVSGLSLVVGCAESASVSTPRASVSAADVKAACQPLRRADWVEDWSEWIGSSPAPGAHPFVRDSVTTRGELDGALVGSITPPSIFGVTEIRVKQGDVVEYQVPRDALVAVCAVDTGSQIYWTNPHQLTRMMNGQTVREPFSTIYVAGKMPNGALRLQLPDGTARTLPIVVSP